MRLLAALMLAPIYAEAAVPVGELAEAFRRTELDPEQCYRVRDVHFSREDLRFYFTDGYLAFAKPVAGRIRAAVFVISETHGDAELMLMPPTRVERVSLAAFTGSPNLNEHFHSALLLFSDDTADVLLGKLKSGGELERSPERGLLLAQDWNATIGNLSASFLVRLVSHVLSGDEVENGLFYAAIGGRTLGNFDVYFDRERAEQIYLGQLKYRDNRPYYDTWTTFPAAPWRKGVKQPSEQGWSVSNYRIEAAIQEQLQMKVSTQVTVSVKDRAVHVLPFDISSGMKVTAVRVNGEAAEIFSPESMRANLIRRMGSTMFLVIPARPLDPGRHYEIHFEHEGQVIAPAGRNVYFVGGRGNWYPQSGIQFSRFDLTFSYPAALQLVFPGDLKEDSTEGEIRTTRRVTPAPIRLAGFNLGDYESVRLDRGGLSVEVFANREVEAALRARRVPETIILPREPNFWPRRGSQQRTEVLVLPPPPMPDPTARLKQLGDNIATAFSLFAEQFGPPALPSLMVSPIPGSFGQGFPGLVYLSTLAYLDPRERPGSPTAQSQLFFDELLAAHETAHQWWGNVVTTANPGDEWLMEALANYSALLVLEKRKGKKAVNSVLQQYRSNLLKKGESGETVESAGPIRLGLRLRSSQAPAAWNTIIYEKGSWIMHMLRRRMGEERFWKLLGELAKRYRYKPISTPEFQKLAAEFLPPDSPDPKLDNFFDSWVNNTGIPKIQLVSSVKGAAPNVRLTLEAQQSGVEEQFSTLVPVEIQMSRAQSRTVWLEASSEAQPITIRLRARPARVVLDPDNSVLTQP